MTKFILIAFGFLGFSFYQLSGGSDFDGEALRLSRVDGAVIKEGPPKVAVAKPLIAGTQNDPAVSRALFSLISADKLNATDTVTNNPLNANAEATTASFVVTQDEEPASAIVLPSLIAQPQAVVEAQDPLAPNDRDIRFVSGNLVNVRGGPSTQFDIVGKLARGFEVEILADNGDGWVEMRSLDGATVGWIADFLLIKG